MANKHLEYYYGDQSGKPPALPSGIHTAISHLDKQPTDVLEYAVHMLLLELLDRRDRPDDLRLGIEQVFVRDDEYRASFS